MCPCCDTTDRVSLPVILGIADMPMYWLHLGEHQGMCRTSPPLAETVSHHAADF